MAVTLFESFHAAGIEIPWGATGEVRTTCPECSADRKKSRDRCLAVNANEGAWICHHCGWTGGIRQFQPTAKPAKTYTKPAYTASPDLSEKARAWFASRGITDAVLVRNKIGEGKAWMPQTGGEVNTVQFPYYRDGEVVNVKYRDGRKDFRMAKGAELALYGLNDIAETTIFVEGEMDKLAVEVAGFPNAVSVPNGAPAVEAKHYDSHFAYLDAAADKLRECREFILAVDADAPGRKLEAELARRLGKGRCRRVRWPAGCKDANDVLVNHGAAALKACIDNAEAYPVEGLIEVDQIGAAYDDLYANGLTPGVSTGWGTVDELYTVKPAQLTILTGIPSHGKSNWLDNLLVRLADLHGWKFGMCSPENFPQERHLAGLAQKWVGKPFSDQTSVARMSADDRDAAKEFLGEHFTWIQPDDEGDWSVDGILALARILVQRKGIRGLVIDPWNELDHERPQGITETEYVSKSLSKLRRFARLHDVHVWLVAHPAKLQKDKHGDYPVPTPYDIAGSAHFRNKADNCLAVWRDFTPGSRVTTLYVQKVRFKEVGKVGAVELAYNWATEQYHEMREARDAIPAAYGTVQRAAGLD